MKDRDFLKWNIRHNLNFNILIPTYLRESDTTYGYERVKQSNLQVLALTTSFLSVETFH